MNKALIGTTIILLFYVLGEIVARYIFPMLPGSVVGMLLLFVALQIGVVKERWVAPVVDNILKNLPLLFLAPAVGIITLYDMVKDDIWSIVAGVVISTVCVLVVVGASLNKLSKDDDNNK